MRNFSKKKKLVVKEKKNSSYNYNLFGELMLELIEKK